MAANSTKKYRVKHNQTIIIDDLYRITMTMPTGTGSGKGRRCELEIGRLDSPPRIRNADSAHKTSSG